MLGWYIGGREVVERWYRGGIEVVYRYINSRTNGSNRVSVFFGVYCSQNMVLNNDLDALS